jgi:hypothetical protein
LEDGNQGYAETRFGSRLCPLNATDLQMALGKLYEEIGSGWSVVIFDSLSTLISIVGVETTLRLVPSVLAKVRQHGSAVVSLTSGIHSESTLAQLYSLFDLIVEMRIEAGEHLERIVKYSFGSYQNEWIPFQILDQGIMLEANRGTNEVVGGK